MSYKYLNLNPDKRATIDCVIRGVSFVTGRDWEDTFLSIAVKCIQYHDMPEVSYIWASYLRDCGFKRYVIPDSCPFCYSVKDFCADHPEGTYLLVIVGHGINGINNSLANAEVSRCNTQANVLQTLNQNQAATMQGMNTIAAGLQNCCCENRAGLADLKYTVATEACSDRQAVTNALFDVTTANNANTQQLMNTINNGIQSIQDKLCALELDGVKNQLAQANRENAGLQSQLAVAQQNNIIQQGFANEVDALYNRLNNCPVPTTPVYGRTPIFTCNNGNGCPCQQNAAYGY